MNPRIDEKRGVDPENARAGPPSPRRDVLPSASICLSGLEEPLKADGPTITFRPIRADDARAYEAMISTGDAPGVDYRFPHVRQPLARSNIDRCTQIDYDREMAFVAASESGGAKALLGEVRMNVFPGSNAAEFAIFVHPDARGLGIGRALLMKMIRYCASRGFSEIIGQVALENESMLALARSVGMQVIHAHGVSFAIVHLNLAAAIDEARSSVSSAHFAADRAPAATGDAIGIAAEHFRPRALASSTAAGRSAYAGLEPNG